MNAAVKRIELRERWHERLEQTKVAQREHAAHVALGGTRPQPRSERRVTIRSPPQSPRGGGSGGGGGGAQQASVVPSMGGRLRPSFELSHAPRFTPIRMEAAFFAQSAAKSWSVSS